MRPLFALIWLLTLTPWASAAFSNGSDRLLANDYMTANQYLVSTDGRFRFYLQGDGNLVLRVVSTNQAVWASATNGKGGVRLNMQSDGNLVLRNTKGSSVWSTQTNGKGANRAVLQNDGRLVLFTAAGGTVWSAGTSQPPADTTKPVITLTGGATMSVVQGSTFTDPGATATDNVDGNLTSRIVKSGSVNTGSVGTYTLQYNVKDNAGNAATTVSRTVTVTVAASATITAPAANAVFAAGQTVTVRANAVDPDGIDVVRLWVDGTYHSLDSSAPYEYAVSGLAPGSHTLYVTSKDTLGNLLNSPTISITVSAPADTIKPVISLTGNATMSVVQGSTFTDPGATATDNVDGNITSRIVKTGSVNTGTVGNYTLSYNVRDNAGNAATTVTRTVTVTAGNTANVIPLPIEVLGPSGTKKSVSFEINDPTGITHLYLRCNACGYHDLAFDKNTSKIKASVRVNGGAAVALKRFTENGTVYGNSQIRIIGGEASYGGIGGTFRTVRMIVPVSGLKSGVNTLTFEHVNADVGSIGFRIIELNLLQNGDLSRPVLSDRSFVEDDPNDWSAPRTSSTDISQGSNLWRQRNRLYDVVLDGLDGQGNGQGTVTGKMQASCSDCHATDGRDLKYFNFSNLSIIERSRFHGLTQAEGEQIASYIRDLDIPIVDQARPWNPPYQPGPGIDSRPVYEWAAGAGVDAILDRESDMAPYLFPNGTSLDAVRAVVDRYETLNFRELPVNIPMPEWNQWLPVIHPDDAFNTSASAIVSDNQGRNVGMPYYKKLYNDAVANPTPDTLGGFSKDIKPWLGRGMTCDSNGVGNGEPYRGLNGYVLDSLKLPTTRVTSSNCTSVNRSSLKNLELAKRGLTAWASVKMWSVIHSNDLEEESQTMTQRICSDGRCDTYSEPRGWVADGRNLFDRPPHFTLVSTGRKYLHQNELQGVFESNTWYHLNMIVNTGYRVTMPSHFAYTYSHVELLQEKSGIDQGHRFWATMIKQRQLQTNGRYGVEEGLDLRTAQPHIYYGTARDKTKTDAQGSVGQPLWGRLAQAMVEDFVEDANNATAQNWADATRNSVVQDRNSTSFTPCSGTCTFDIGPYQGRNTYRVIPELRKIGVEDTAIQRLIDWGAKTWPKGPWSRLR
jgi:hypothetical protein